MKLPILILLTGAMGVAHAVPISPLKSERQRTVMADTERGGIRDISFAEEPQIDLEDIDDSSVTLTDEAQDQADYAEWAWGVAAENPELMIEEVSDGGKAKVVIEVNKSTQRGKIIVAGKVVETFKLSTGKVGHATPSGNFKPGARKVNWLSNFASRQYGRPIYLKHAVQISGGAFMHAASAGAMNYLGTRRSSGCVRVPPRIAAKVYGLVNSNKAVFRVH